LRVIPSLPTSINQPRTEVQDATYTSRERRVCVLEETGGLLPRPEI